MIRRAQDLAGRLAPPSAEHWLGTDELGPRPVHAPAVRRPRHAGHGDRRRRDGGTASASPSARVAGYAGGLADRVLMRVTDIFLAFPRLILALAFVAALKPGIDQRRHRHRAHRLAALCAPRPRRDADHPPCRFHRRRAADRRIGGTHRAAPHRAALRLLADRARHARHERHHPDRRRPRLSRHGRAAADAGMGHDDRGRRAASSWNNGGCRRSRAWRSSPPRSPSTCWAMACATCSIRSRADDSECRSEADGSYRRQSARRLPLADRAGGGGARRVLHAGPGEARHRRRVRLGQVADGARHHAAAAAGGAAIGRYAELRRHRRAARQRAHDAAHPRRPRRARDAGPEILAQSGDDRRRADRRGVARASRRQPARGARGGGRSAGAGADPRSRRASPTAIRTSCPAAWASA